jgi:hypothetical protein
MSSKPTPEAQDAAINVALEEYGKLVLTILSAKIQERKLVLTGELLKSLQYDVLKASSTQVGTLLLAFEESGRIKDMRQINRRKLPPVSVMEEFVQKVGLGKFKYVPGYSKTAKPLTENAMMRRIAWGLTFSHKEKTKHKPKKWFSKPFYSTIHTLIDTLMNDYQRLASGAVTRNLNSDGSTAG